MACRFTLRVFLVLCGLVVAGNAGAQSREVSLSSTPFSFVGPAFQNVAVTAREYDANSRIGRGIDVFLNGSATRGVITLLQTGGDSHFTNRTPVKRVVEGSEKPSLDRGEKITWGKTGRVIVGVGRYDYRHYTIGTRTCVGFTNFFDRSGEGGWRTFLSGTFCTSAPQGDEDLRALFAGIGVDPFYTPTVAATTTRDVPADQNPSIAKKNETPAASGKTRQNSQAARQTDGVDGVYAVRLIYAGQDKPGCLGGELKAEFTVVQDSIRGYFNHPQVGFFLLKGTLDGNDRLVDAVAEGGEKVFFDGGFSDGAGTGTWRSDISGCRGAWAATRN